MTKQDILDYFSLIDFAYNESGRLESLSRMLDELLKEQDETIKELQKAYGYLQKQFFEAQDKLLKEQEAVVRCKDCKHGHRIINTVNGEVRLYRVLCTKPYEQGSTVHEPNWSCADGERSS